MADILRANPFRQQINHHNSTPLRCRCSSRLEMTRCWKKRGFCIPKLPLSLEFFFPLRKAIGKRAKKSIVVFVFFSLFFK